MTKTKFVGVSSILSYLFLLHRAFLPSFAHIFASSIPTFWYRFLATNHERPQAVSTSPINDSQLFSIPNNISQRVTPVLTLGLDIASDLGAVWG